MSVAIDVAAVPRLFACQFSICRVIFALMIGDGQLILDFETLSLVPADKTLCYVIANDFFRGGIPLNFSPEASSDSRKVTRRQRPVVTEHVRHRLFSGGDRVEKVAEMIGQWSILVYFFGSVFGQRI